MSAYLLANITVNNPENYKEYVEKVKSIVEKFDGEYLVRGGEMTVIEGDWPHKRNIVIKCFSTTMNNCTFSKYMITKSTCLFFNKVCS